MIDKFEKQMESVLQGEATLLQLAEQTNNNIEKIEAKMREIIDSKKYFGHDDALLDLMMACYMIGRKDQFLATCGDFFGREAVIDTYNKVCIKLGLNRKTLLN
jgi:hypothetical protein